MAYEPLRAWIHDRFGAYAKTSLLTLIFLGPLIFSRTTLQAFNVTKATVIWILGILALATFALWSLHTGRRFMTCSVINVGAAFVVFALLATLLSSYRAVSLLGMYRRYSGLVSLTMFIVIMVLLIQVHWDRPETLDTLIRVSVAAATVVAGYVFVQAAGLDWITWPVSLVVSTYPPGTVGNSNFCGAYLAISSPLFAYLALRADSPASKAWFFGLFGVNLLGVWFTGTRGGGLAVVAGLGTMALFYRRKGSKLRWTLAAASLIAAAGFAGLLLSSQGFLTRFQMIRYLGPSSFLERISYWRTALRILANHPFLGTGPNTYYANFTPYRSRAEAALNGIYMADAPHNIFLGHAAETGLLGAGAFCALVGIALFHAFRYLKRSEEGQRMRLLAFTAMLVAYLTQGFFSIDVPSLALSGWVSLGAVAAIADPKLALARRERGVGSAGGTVSRNQLRQIPVLLTAGIGLTTVLLLVVIVRPFLADVWAGSADPANDFPEALSLYSAASKLNPLEAEYHGRAGDAFAEEANAKKSGSSKLHLTKAIDEYRRALELRPRWIPYMAKAAVASTDLAQLSNDFDAFARAEEWWRMAADLDPNDWRLRYLRSETFRLWARAAQNSPELRHRQIQELRTSIALKRGQPKAWVRLASAYNAIGQSERADATLQSYFGYVLNNEEKAAIIRSPAPSLGLGQDARPRDLRDALTVIASLIGVALIAYLVPYRMAKKRTLVGSGRANPSVTNDSDHPAELPDSGSFSGSQRWRPVARALGRVRRHGEALELLALPGFWSLALAIPHFGPLFGLPVYAEDIFGLVIYLVPGLLLVGLPVIAGVMKHRPDHSAAPDEPRVRWLTGVTLLSLAMALVHLPELGRSLDGQIPWTYPAIHLAPAFLSVAISRLLLASRSGLDA